MGLQSGHLPQVHHQPVGNLDVSQFSGDLHIGDHGAAVEENFPLEADRRVHHLLHPVDIAGKGRHHDSPGAFGENLVKGFSHVFFREGEAAGLDIGGIGQQRQDPFLTIAGKGGQVGEFPVHGGLVQLEVAGVDHHPLGGADGQAAAVHNGVGDPDEFHLEGPQPDLVPGLHHVELHGALQFKFLELFPDEPQGEGRAEEGRSDVPQDKGEGADVVFVAVGEDDAADLLPVLTEIGDVGDDDVDPQHVRFGKHEAAVHHDDVVSVLKDGHVHPDLPHSTQGDDLQSASIFHL